MNLKSRLILFILASVLTCCDTGEPSKTDTTVINNQNVDVYVYGSLGGIATYWKNGVSTSLADGEIVVSMAVLNNEIHLIGYGGGKAMYWKNGTSQVLGNGYDGDPSYSSINSTFLNEIISSGLDIYIVGSQNKKCAYWKNGEIIYLTDGITEFSRGYGITVTNEDVYIAGYVWPNANFSYEPWHTPAYWKNGVINKLPEAYANLLKIAVLNHDIYIVGQSCDDCLAHSYGGLVGHQTARYWKNGISVALTDGRGYASAKSISISGNDIYIAGDDGFQGTFSAKYWKNGSLKIISSDNSSANQICVFKNDVYIVGSKWAKGILWVNGEPLSPFIGDNEGMKLRGVLVKEK